MSKYDIAGSMNNIMSDPKYQSVFFKTAAAKTDKEKAQADKEKAKAKEAAEKEKAKLKAEKEKQALLKTKEKEQAAKEKAKLKADKAKAKAEKDKKAKANYYACVMGLSKISEVLDNHGFSKASALAIMSLDSLIKAAGEEECEDCGEANDKEKEDDECEVDDVEMPAETISGNDNTVVMPPLTVTNKPANGPFDFSNLMGNDKSPKANAPDTGAADDFDEDLRDIMDELEEIDSEHLEEELEELSPRDFEREENPEEFTFTSLIRSDNEKPSINNKAANKQVSSLQKLSQKLSIILAAEKNPKAKIRNKSKAIFDNKNPKVKDDKDHFPIDTIGRARNALAQVKKYDKVPPWYSGSLKELQSAVTKAVKKEYPSIEVGYDKKAKKASFLA